MVFAVNCGANGTANSFTNFQNAALAVGASLSAAAAASTATAYGGYPAPTGTTAPNSPTSTPAVGGQVHTVVVGGTSLVFDPPHISALPGDTVVFEL